MARSKGSQHNGVLACTAVNINVDIHRRAS